MDGRDRESRSRAGYMKEYRAAYKLRTRRVAITLTQEEHEAARRRAEAAGLALAAYAKEALTGTLATASVLPRETAAKLDEFVRQVRGVATNVNQMAKHSNALRAAADAGEVMLRLRYLEELVRKFVEGGPRP